MKRSDNSRLFAARVLLRVFGRYENLDEALQAVSGKDAGASRDQSFSRHLVYGVLRWLSALEWIADQLLKRPLKQKDQDIYQLILIGLFQMWKSDSADHAAVHETAECARLLKKPWAVGLINAVLRRFQREQAAILEKLASQPARHAHPEWLLNSLQDSWPDEWEDIVEANNTQAGLWLRVNRTRSDIETVAQKLTEAGLTTSRHAHAPDALKVSPPTAVERLPGFSEGLWSVQDPAAQLAASWLDVQPGQHFLDACAAPGGKTCHTLESVPDATVVALDRSETRLERLVHNAERLGLTDDKRLQVTAADALDTGNWFDGQQFDRILLDAPCTATGVIRRHPDIKWLRTPEQVTEAVQLQSALLRRLWPLLKPGGILVYATCSVLEDENSRQTRQFTVDCDDAEPELRQLAYGRASGHGVQILPGESDMDGFFYSRFRKKA